VGSHDRAAPRLAYESRNAPTVMTPWELRDHLGFLMSEVTPGRAEVQGVGQVLNRLRVSWHALWARSGGRRSGVAGVRRPSHERLEPPRTARRRRLAAPERMMLGRCLRALVFEAALGGSTRAMDGRIQGGAGRAAAAAAARPASAAGPGRDPVFDRPVFIVSSPRSGSTLLFETLMKAPGLFTVGGESHALMESIPAISPAATAGRSNRLTAADAVASTVGPLRDRFRAAVRDRDGAPPAADPIRLLEKTPKNACASPSWPRRSRRRGSSTSIEIPADPGEHDRRLLSGGFRTYPGLPGWPGPVWSFLLTPGWRDLAGAPLARIVARQWSATTRALLDDLAALPANRWLAVRYEAFVAAPQEEISRICRGMDLTWDRRLGASLPLARPHADRARSRQVADPRRRDRGGAGGLGPTA